MAFGLTSLGFVPKRLSDIQTEVRLALQEKFGTGVSLSPETVLGQTVGITSEREALLWELCEALYHSRYPEGAEGTSVDNILSLNNLRRLQARPTVTSEPDTSGTPGLVLYGTAGTVIQAGSIIYVDGSAPQIQFTIDDDATIEAAVDEIQGVFFSQVPDAGQFKLSIGLLTTAFIDYTAVAADVQAAINALAGYEDVLVTGSFATGFSVTFTGDVGAQAVDLMVASDSTLMSGVTVVNISVVINTQGKPAQVVSSATCANVGAIEVPAGSLTGISTPIGGWSGVNNPLDCIAGALVEDDTTALQRRSTLLSAQANGPIQAIVQKIKQLTNVTQAVPFENLTLAAIQIISYDIVPTVGSYILNFGLSSTAAIPYTATPAEIQTAIRLVTGYETVLVTGAVDTGLAIDFNGSWGGSPRELITVSSNTTDAAITVAYGRPGKSFEIVVLGGDENKIAETIFNSKPSGIETYGNTEVVMVDDDGNTYPTKFSRPVQVPIYVSIVLETDIEDDYPLFSPASVVDIQEKVVAKGELFPIGGVVKGFGSDGLIGSFNDVPGIKSYTMYFGRSPSPVSNANLQLSPGEIAEFQSFNIIASYT